MSLLNMDIVTGVAPRLGQEQTTERISSTEQET